MTREEQLAHLKDLKQRYRALKRDAEQAKQDHDRFEMEVFQDMQSTNTFSQRQGNTRYDLKSTIFGVVQDREAFTAWCEQNGYDGEFLRRVEEKARVNELVRAAIDNNEEMPPGVGWYAKEYISITEKGD